MKIFGKAVKAVAIVLALTAGSMHAKPAKADGGAIIAGVAGALILGTIIGSSTAHANNGYYAAPVQPHYQAPRRHYYAPAPVYAPAPIYVPRPSVNFTFGSYYSPKRHGYRGHGYRGHRAHRGHRGYHKRHNRRHYRRYHH